MGMMTWAQRHVSVAISSVLALGATVITAVGAWVFFDQPLGAVQIVGGIVVLASLGGLVLSQIGSPNATIVEPAWLPEAQDTGGAGPR
jgi:drug/metabolite transporter (DMT)-like permease